MQLIVYNTNIKAMKKLINNYRWKSKTHEKFSNKIHPEKVNAKLQRIELDVSFQQAMWPGYLDFSIYFSTQFHSLFSVYTVIAGAHIFGIMPIVGVRPWRSNVSRFKWISARTILCLLTILLGSIVVYMYMHRLHQAGFTAKNLGKRIGFSTCI